MTATIQALPPLSPLEITERGEAIYRENYQTDFEQQYNGKFVVIDISTKDATVSNARHDAIRMALDKNRDGLFYLLRVGHESAFERGWYMRFAN